MNVNTRKLNTFIIQSRPREFFLWIFGIAELLILILREDSAVHNNREVRTTTIICYEIDMEFVVRIL